MESPLKRWNTASSPSQNNYRSEVAHIGGGDGWDGSQYGGVAGLCGDGIPPFIILSFLSPHSQDSTEGVTLDDFSREYNPKRLHGVHV